MEYDDPQHLHFNLSYEDNDYMFDYEFVIDKEKPEFEFIQHSCDKGVEHIDLRRQNDFEKEIFKYLFA